MLTRRSTSPKSNSPMLSSTPEHGTSAAASIQPDERSVDFLVVEVDTLASDFLHLPTFNYGLSPSTGSPTSPLPRSPTSPLLSDAPRESP
jgi:hypothetical protein